MHMRGWRRRQDTWKATAAAVLLVTVGQVSPPAPPAKQMIPNRAAASKKFADLSDQFIKESLVLSPVSASSAGYHKYTDPRTGETIELDGKLDDLSPDGAARQRDFYAKWRDRFRNEAPVESLGPEDAADWQLIDNQVAQQLLEYDEIQSYRHNPTIAVELIGNALFLPLTQDYATKDIRLGHVLSRIRQIPRAINEAELSLVDADPIFISIAIKENEGNVDLIEHSVADQISVDSPLNEEFERDAAPAVAALRDFARWLKDDLAARPTVRTWRLGTYFYDKKFKLVMQTEVKPSDVLADAQRDLAAVRMEMYELALPMHKEMYPNHSDHSNLVAHDQQNTIIGEVLDKIAEEHPKRDQLQSTIQADLEGIAQFIREKKIVTIGTLENLKVIPTPAFMRGVYSVAGFHSAPPLEPKSEAEYWVTPIDPKAPEGKVESKLREYNDYTLQWLSIHEALPGHYVQFEHLNKMRPERRRLLRSLYANGPYVEGWAEYVAQVMTDEGFLHGDPRFRMVINKIRLRDISNAILDISMQTKAMTDEQALDLMTNEAFQTQAEADGKLVRIKLTSTQLPTYYVGVREWLAFRKAYQAAVGKNFNLLAFHDRALDEGPLPVPVVQALLMPPGRKPQ